MKHGEASGAVAISTRCCRHLQAAAEVKKGKVADAKVWAKVFKNGGVGAGIFGRLFVAKLNLHLDWWMDKISDYYLKALVFSEMYINDYIEKF